MLISIYWYAELASFPGLPNSQKKSVSLGTRLMLSNYIIHVWSRWSFQDGGAPLLGMHRDT